MTGERAKGVRIALHVLVGGALGIRVSRHGLGVYSALQVGSVNVSV